MAEQAPFIRIINKTNFFTRESFMYSFGDVKLKRPISLRKVGYTMLFFAVWSLPIFLLFGFHFNLPFFAIFFGVPIGMGILASMPIFGGKSLKNHLRSVYKYFKEADFYADLKERKRYNGVYRPDATFWVSRRRELKQLLDARSRNRRK